MSVPSYLHRLSLALNARDDELRPALYGFLLFLCLFTGYFMLRPIRESMGIAAGVENLQWLFTATFLVMLVAVPLFAWVSSRVPAVQRHRIERGRQAMRRHAFGDALEAAIGAKRIAFPGEHARRIFAFALERKHAGREREITGQVFLHQEAQRLTLVLIARQRDLADLGAGQRFAGLLRADFLVADLHDIFVLRVALLQRRPLREHGPGLRRQFAVLGGNQFIDTDRKSVG